MFNTNSFVGRFDTKRKSTKIDKNILFKIKTKQK